MATVNEISDETLAELAGGTEHGMSRQEVHAFRVALVNMDHGDDDTATIPEGRWLEALDRARRQPMPTTNLADYASVRAAKIDRVSSSYGARTVVTLADGYKVTLLGRLGKGDAVRCALRLRASGCTSEAVS